MSFFALLYASTLVEHKVYDDPRLITEKTNWNK